MSTHTPIWIGWPHPDGSGFSIESESGRRIACHANVLIDTEPDPAATRDEIAANMALLAAAPALLAACELAIEDASPFAAEDLDEGIIISPSAYEAIRAAIALAKP